MQTKRLLLILSIGFFQYTYGQTYPDLEKVLTKELSKDSEVDGRWIFYADNANIKKVDKPLVKVALPNYDFFEVSLTNYLGWHVNRGTCLVLFDSSTSKIKLAEPIWYGGVSQPLIKMFIGKKYENKDSLFNFLKELNDLMEIGSRYKFRNTAFTDSLITYDLGYFKGDAYTTGGSGISSTVRYNEDGVWRKVVIDIRNLKIIRYTSINPVTSEKEIIE